MNDPQSPDVSPRRSPPTRLHAKPPRKIPAKVVTGPAPHTLVPPVSQTMPGLGTVPEVPAPSIVPTKKPPPTSPGGRHVLRSANEYPSDEIQGGLHHIPRSSFPSGFDLQWLAVTVWGQPLDFSIADFTRKGWEPVYPEDFNGAFAYLVPTGWTKPIIVQDLMLVARSMAWSDEARRRAKQEAQGAVNIKVNQLRNGELERVTLNPQHKHLDKTNYINSSIEGIRVPTPAADDGDG